MSAEKRSDTTGIGWTHFPDGYLGVESWTGMTWNPTVGCTRVSPGCDHCYAFTLHDQRFAKNREAARAFGPFRQMDLFGTTETALVRSIGKPLPWPPQYDRPFSQVQLLPDRLDQPLHWRKPRAVFVDSMADLFHEDVTDDYLDRTFAAMFLGPQHIFMVLTKRPERAFEYIRSRAPHGSPHAIGYYVDQMDPKHFDGRERVPFVWPLPNVWLGVSVEDQERAHERIPVLLDTPAAIRFISAEPLLAPLDLRNFLYPAVAQFEPSGPKVPIPTLDWVLVGGESGKGHRDMPVMWAADIQRQCHEAGVAYFGKQRSDFRSGLALPPPLGEKQWPAAQWGGVQHGIWRAG